MNRPNSQNGNACKVYADVNDFVRKRQTNYTLTAPTCYCDNAARTEVLHGIS